MTDPRPAILEDYRWLQSDLQKSGVVWYGDTWTLNATPSQLWPLFHDTSRLNRALRLPKSEYTERDGKRVGTTQYFRQTFAWDEPPWEWIHDRLLVCRKTMTKGPVSAVVAILTFNETTRGTDFSVWYGWQPRGVVGRVVAPRLTSYLKTSFELLIPRVTDWLNGARAWSDSPMQRRRTKVAPDVEAAVGRARARLLERGHATNAIDVFIEHLLYADPLELDRIRPLQLARDHGVSDDAMIDVALDATDVGLTHARWDVLCPHCRGMRSSLESLSGIPERLNCDACAVAFEPADQQLELTFRTHERIRTIEPRVYCAAEAALKPHIFVQMKPDSARDIQLDMVPGSYVLRAADLSTHLTLQVVAPSPTKQQPVVVPDGGTVTVHQHQMLKLPATGALWIIETAKPTGASIRAADVLSRPSYRAVMGTEELPANLALEVGVQTLLFTDVVSSTAMYRDMGDISAFIAVKKHFSIVFGLINDEGGVVIKTIGDAVMAAFTSPENAARAAQEIAIADLGQIEVRVSLHSGPCLAVNLNKGVDYFGSVVNEAAKLQAAAGASEIAVSPELAERLGIAGTSVDYTSGGEPRTAVVWSAGD